MEIRYYAGTDTLYIELSKNPSAESSEIGENVVLDYDASNNVVAIEIEHASTMLAKDILKRGNLPVTVKK